MIQCLEPQECRGDSEPRFELKLTTDRCELHRVRAWFRTHPYGFSTLYPSRRVNSVYFDTPDLASYFENLAGVASRWKIRLRWYGTDLARVDGTLEIKRKQGLLGWKPQYKLSDFVRLDDTTWPAVRRSLRSQVPEAWRACLDRSHCPLILASYTRAYYGSADGVVRATVDVDQAVYDQRRSVRPNLDRPSPLVDRVIIELKCVASQRERLMDVASAFPIRVERHSKYVSSVDAVCAS